MFTVCLFFIFVLFIALFLPLTPFLSGAASSFIIKGIVSDADLGGLDAAIAEAVDVALGDTEAIAMLPPGLRQKLENQGKVCKPFMSSIYTHSPQPSSNRPAFNF